MSEKTVFISYRRDAIGQWFARNLKEELTHRGYDVFLDVDCVEAGKWAEQILLQVPKRDHFLLLLTPGALDNCSNADDWVRREFELAKKSGRNIVPIREESVKLLKARKSSPASMVGVFEFQIATIRQSTFSQDIEALIQRFIPTHKAPPTGPSLFFSKQLLDGISRLHTHDDIRDSVVRVLSHPEYPRWMSVSDKLVRNPIWDHISEDRQKTMQRAHQLDGPSPPTLMHLDMLLIRRNDSRGYGELYTYFSRDWGTHLLCFRQQLPEDDPTRRSEMNAQETAKYCDGLASSISVTPQSGKFAVSVKPHPKYGDLIIYVFEFCSVAFTSEPDFVRESKDNRGFWFKLDSLRTDLASWTVNADVIRAIHELFTVTLGPLPVSCPVEPPTKTRKKGAKS